MQIKILHILIFTAVAIGCDNNITNNETTEEPSTSATDSSFQKIADDFLDGYLAWRPQSSVALGFHEYDGKTTSLHKSSLDSELTRLKQYDQKLSALDTGGAMIAKTFYDYRILRSGIHSEIFS